MNSLVRRAVRPFFNLFSAIGKTGLWFTVPMKGKYRLRFYSRKKCIDRNFDKNLSAFENHISRIDRDRGFIEDQNLYKDMYYGASTMAESGCGVIAVYNALKALSINEAGSEGSPSLPNLISIFENRIYISHENKRYCNRFSYFFHKLENVVEICSCFQ